MVAVVFGGRRNIRDVVAKVFLLCRWRYKYTDVLSSVSIVSKGASQIVHFLSQVSGFGRP